MKISFIIGISVKRSFSNYFLKIWTNLAYGSSLSKSYLILSNTLFSSIKNLEYNSASSLFFKPNGFFYNKDLNSLILNIYRLVVGKVSNSNYKQLSGVLWY
jgi:hypothetical protein